VTGVYGHVGMMIKFSTVRRVSVKWGYLNQLKGR